MTATFIEHFSDLKDPRDDKNKKHHLMDILRAGQDETFENFW
jgi:hypothetical protein